MTAGDLMGPVEAFSQATIAAGNTETRRCYEVVMIGATTGICVTDSSIILKPQVEMRRAPVLDTLIVPGGSGIHNLKLNKPIGKWLIGRAANTRRLVALGTGIYALAATGLLDGRQVVVHWRFAKDLASRFPRLQVNCNNIFGKDGSFYTSPGGVSAIDLSLTLIEEDYGRQIALALARELIVHVKRSCDHEQYSEPLRFQVQSSDRFAEIPAWILSQLNHDLSVDSLARKAGMSRRNFTRVFHKAFGKTASQFVTEARIAEAQKRLLVPRNSIENVANSLGFQSADVFSVAFERLAGIRPSIYRTRRLTSAAIPSRRLAA